MPGVSLPRLSTARRYALSTFIGTGRQCPMGRERNPPALWAGGTTGLTGRCGWLGRKELRNKEDRCRLSISRHSFRCRGRHHGRNRTHDIRRLKLAIRALDRPCCGAGRCRRHHGRNRTHDIRRLLRVGRARQRCRGARRMRGRSNDRRNCRQRRWKNDRHVSSAFLSFLSVPRGRSTTPAISAAAPFRCL
jgi:hypothetical protein